VTLRQFTGVAIGGRAVLIAGDSGVGKSSLALALIDRGAVLIGDDGVALAVRDGDVWAMPAPATRGLIEVRGVGLVTLPVCGGAAVALVLRLEDGAPRFIEAPPQVELCGVMVPEVTLWPGSPVLALRAEMALAAHGLGTAKHVS